VPTAHIAVIHSLSSKSHGSPASTRRASIELASGWPGSCDISIEKWPL
jgi:hypothetical protein